MAERTGGSSNLRRRWLNRPLGAPTRGGRDGSIGAGRPSCLGLQDLGGIRPLQPLGWEDLLPQRPAAAVFDLFWEPDLWCGAAKVSIVSPALPRCFEMIEMFQNKVAWLLTPRARRNFSLTRSMDAVTLGTIGRASRWRFAWEIKEFPCRAYREMKAEKYGTGYEQIFGSSSMLP